jgi:hypothetical protein
MRERVMQDTGVATAVDSYKLFYRNIYVTCHPGTGCDMSLRGRLGRI